ncbi:hypothetical protein Y032_0044g914 [Ancylostoma ceylanicum]|uniref:Endonuclease/exonuclease/phosphatase domain-containing protein n=1 Tax=Ancylostoma ceylanicum TaxID=53326 RepID=A0A016UFB6_9BILA|nr:hypothetical protein Y032_0044g914 [Ancylostoma ceylanicum]
MLLDEKTAEVPLEDTIVAAGDLNGHVGATKDGYRCQAMGVGHGTKVVSAFWDMRLSQPCHRKYEVLVRHRDQKLVTGAKVVPYDTVATQHRPPICTKKIMPIKRIHEGWCGPVRIRWWRLREKKATVTFRNKLPPITNIDEAWKNATQAIAEVAHSVLDTTKQGRRRIDRLAWL